MVGKVDTFNAHQNVRAIAARHGIHDFRGTNHVGMRINEFDTGNCVVRQIPAERRRVRYTRRPAIPHLHTVGEVGADNAVAPQPRDFTAA